MAKSILRTNEVMKDICEALGLPYTKVNRVTFEFAAGEPVSVGVEMRPEKEDGAAIVGVIATSVAYYQLTQTGTLTHKPVDETAELTAEASE